MPANPGAPYRVVRSERIREQLRKWGETALSLGLIEPYGEALAAIEAKLAEEPLTWGDPLYRFRHLHLLLRRGVHGFFLVEYAVREDLRLVIVREYRLLPGNPLEPAN